MKGTSKPRLPHLRHAQSHLRVRGCFLSENAAMPPGQQVKVYKSVSLVDILEVCKFTTFCDRKGFKQRERAQNSCGFSANRATRNFFPRNNQNYHFHENCCISCTLHHFIYVCLHFTPILGVLINNNNSYILWNC